MWIAVLCLAGCLVLGVAVLIQASMDEHWRKFRWFEIEEESADVRRRSRGEGRRD